MDLSGFVVERFDKNARECGSSSARANDGQRRRGLNLEAARLRAEIAIIARLWPAPSPRNG